VDGAATVSVVQHELDGQDTRHQPKRQLGNAPDLIANLGTVSKWDLDACANRLNVCERFHGPEDDGHFH
jgi:hypothetical protein